MATLFKIKKRDWNFFTNTGNIDLLISYYQNVEVTAIICNYYSYYYSSDYCI